MKKPGQQFETIIKKSRGIRKDATPIPAKIKPAQLPKAYAEGYEPQVTAKPVSRAQAYNESWRLDR